MIRLTTENTKFTEFFVFSVVRILVLLAVHSTLAPLQAAGGPALSWESLGPRLEIVVTQEGIYELSCEALKSAGLDIERIDPRNLQMMNQGREVAIRVEGEEDGTFDPGDRILFYGEKFRGDVLAARYASLMTGEGPANNWLWLCRPDCRLSGMFEKYTDENIYWLRSGPGPGLRTAAVDARPGSAPPADHYIETIRAEESQEWWSHEFGSEDSFFWEQIRTPLWTERRPARAVTRSYPIQLTGVAPGEHSVTVRASMASRNHGSGNPDHHTRLTLNSEAALLEDALWDGPVRHTVEAVVPQSVLREGANELHLTLLPEVESGKRVALNTPRMYFDWFEVQYARRFLAESGQLVFSRTVPGTWQYGIENLTAPQVVILDISDPVKPRELVNSASGAGQEPGIVFQATHDEQARFIAAAEGSIREPVRIRYYEPPDFATLPEADYLFITHPFFKEPLKKLADYRSSQGLKVAILDVEDLYKEFNDGIFHPIAIRNFLDFAFRRWSRPPQYAVLVGSGHWNFKGFSQFPSPPNYMPPNLAYIDPWQGEVDSANLLATLVGDDTVPDLHIARLPVSSREELETVTRKIIQFEEDTAGPWRRNLVFIADNVPDPGGDFVRASDRIIGTFLDPRDFDTTRIYLNDFHCSRDTDPGCLEVTEAILGAFNETGALLVNFVGHAALERWTHEKVFSRKDIPRLTNRDRLPVLLSMTCLDGYWFHPGRSNLVSDLLFSEGGIVAAFSPTGLGLTEGHEILHRGFYAALLEDGIEELGAAVMRGKKELAKTHANQDLMHTFTIFGDPALRIRFPAAPAAASDTQGR